MNENLFAKTRHFQKWRVKAREEGRVCKQPGCGQEISKSDWKDCQEKRQGYCLGCFKVFCTPYPVNNIREE
jgi:hypothetical protein